MKTRRKFSSVFLFLISFCLIIDVDSQSSEKTSATKQIKNPQSAVAKLRELYRKRDYESGFELGGKLTEQFPDDDELKAWFIVNMARNDMTEQAVAAAKKFVESEPENAWAQFALANAYIRNSQGDEAFFTAEKALKLKPDDEEFILLYASALLAQKKYDETYAWLDKNSARVKDRSRLLVSKAEAEYRQATGGAKIDETKRNRSLATFAEARRLNPNSVAASYVYGVYLNAARRFAEAAPVLKKAVALSPEVAHIRQQYWRAVLNGQPAKTAEQRKREVVADMNTLLRLRPGSVNALETVSAFYESELKMPEKQKEIDAIILQKFPLSSNAEGILVRNYREFQKNNTENGIFKDEKLKEKYKQMLWAFINRQPHVNENLLGDSYFSLLMLVKDDPKIPNDELLKIVEDTAKYEKLNPHVVYPQGASVLADRKMFRQAERLARQGFAAGRARLESQRASYTDEKEYRNALNWSDAGIQDALGWVYFKENRFDEAERELLKAVDLSDRNPTTFNHLGQLYEAKKDLAKAEDFYIKAFANSFSLVDNPNISALKSLYEKRSGNLNGFEAYFKKVEEIERATRKERVISTKIEDSKSVNPFRLKNLEDKTVSFADLKGKIVVVNIWGTWCGPCVQEMPEFQELHKKYAGDKDVAILTINNDGDLALVKKFMTDKRFDFAVLRDENYLSVAGINAFPTTWFIDRDGKISFVQVGNNGKLLEEFVWRIEELRK